MTGSWIRRARRGAAGLATARTAIGVVALAEPALVGRPWVGAAAEGTPGRVLARALGGRDLAHGQGAHAAVQHSPLASRPVAGVWVGMGALADSVDLLATLTAWDRLPPVTRWLVAASAGGAAVAGTVVAWALITGDDDS